MRRDRLRRQGAQERRLLRRIYREDARCGGVHFHSLIVNVGYFRCRDLGRVEIAQAVPFGLFDLFGRHAAVLLVAGDDLARGATPHLDTCFHDIRFQVFDRSNYLD